MTRAAKKRLIFSAVMLFAAAVLLEGACFALLTILDAKSGMGLSKALMLRQAELAWAWGDRVYCSVFDPITQVRHKPGTSYYGLRVNENGYIENGNPDPALSAWPEKPAGTVRVALLGGSSTAGYGVSDNSDTIAAILERRLNLAYGGPERRFQVLNLGFAGGYSAMEAALFMNQVIYLAPDAVIFLDGYNDVFNALFEHQRNRLPHPLLNWFDYSYATFAAMNGYPERPWPRLKVLTWFSVAIARLSQAILPRDVTELYEGYPHYRLSGRIAALHPYLENVALNNLEAVASYCAVNKIPAIFCLQPQPLSGGKKLTAEEKAGIKDWFDRFSALSPFIDTKKMISETNAAFGALEKQYEISGKKFAPWPHVRFVSLTGLFASETETVYVDSLHTNERGNALFAERYFTDLTDVLNLSARP